MDVVFVGRHVRGFVVVASLGIVTLIMLSTCITICAFLAYAYICEYVNESLGSQLRIIIILWLAREAKPPLTDPCSHLDMAFYLNY